MDRYPLLFLYRAWSYRLERRCFYPGFCILLPPVYWKTFFFFGHHASVLSACVFDSHRFCLLGRQVFKRCLTITFLG
jgi:hypothetical protein